LKERCKKVLRSLLSKDVYERLRHFYLEYGEGYSVPSYSQEGEDIMLLSLFPEKRNGFYVDIGAHHPKRFSNTQLFYRRGWRGINIDPDPGSFLRFQRHRKRDTNLCLGVGKEQESLEYFILNEPALNSFNRELTEERVKDGNYRIIETQKIPVVPLSIILDEHLGDERIDFLDVDTEGMDLEVLFSNDWTRFRPDVVLAEMLGAATDAMEDNDIFKFLTGEGYELVARTSRSGMFLRNP